MDVVLIFNGLGNQMSQYAFYLAKKDFDSKTMFVFSNYSHNYHNGFELYNAFGIQLKSSYKYMLISFLYKLYHKKIMLNFLNLVGYRVINEPCDYSYSRNLLYKGPGIFNIYWGGWHSEKYFVDIKNNIINTFQFKVDKNDQYLNFYKRRIESIKNSVSVHVRRGDYLSMENNKLSDICDVNYYRIAISYFADKFFDCQFFVFSDDINWCKDNIKGENFIFVEDFDKINSWKDMYLMSLCRHHINANSTFSWWAAWLSPYKDSIVIRPHWFIKGIQTDDFYPDKWLDINDINNY